MSSTGSDSDSSVGAQTPRPMRSVLSDLSLEEKGQRLEHIESSTSIVKEELDKLRALWSKLNMIYTGSKNQAQRDQLQKKMYEIDEQIQDLLHAYDLHRLEKELLEDEICAQEERENTF